MLLSIYVMTISVRKAKVLLRTSMKITGTHMLTSLVASSASPLLPFHLYFSPGQRVMTFHNYCYSWNSRLPLFCIPEVSCCFHCFFLGNNRSERLIASHNTLRIDASDTLMHFSCGWIFGTRRNESPRKMDRGFTVTESYKFLTVVSSTFCQLP